MYLYFPEVLQGNEVAAEVQHEDEVQADDEDEQEEGFETSDQSEEWSSESKSPEHEEDSRAPRLQVSPPNDSPTSTLSASTTTWSGSQRRWLG
jgi:hypothetical protein